MRVPRRASTRLRRQAPARVGLTALGRFGSTADIAAAVAFLAGESGRSITGTVLTVDSGTNA